jgi:predicted component of type VI protein secretion system
MADLTPQERLQPSLLDRLTDENPQHGMESRLLRNKLSVTVEKQPAAMNRNSLVFMIRAEMWAQPVPQSIFMRTEFDLETGTVKVDDGS